MTRIDTVFFDIGGVCLTNGWDSDARQAAARQFSLDVDELDLRHQTQADAFERGERSLDAYLDHVIFDRPRSFPREAFITFMHAQSQPHESVLRLARHLVSGGCYRLATINNESRELNRHRIETFGLRDIFGAFFSSCYVGVRKPDARIYEIALDVMRAEPSTSLFVDDREENATAARRIGMHAIHVTDLAHLREQLVEVGVEIPVSGPASKARRSKGGERPRGVETAARVEGRCRSV